MNNTIQRINLYSLDSVTGLPNTSLRSKRFQSSYCAKVRAEAKKKRLKGEGEGRRGNACRKPIKEKLKP